MCLGSGRHDISYDEKNSNSTMRRCARTRGIDWDKIGQRGPSVAAGDDDERRRAGATPAKKFDALGARFEREREGKQRGSHGLPIGELRVLIMALNARNQSAESKQMAGSFQFGRKTMLTSGDVISFFFLLIQILNIF